MVYSRGELEVIATAFRQHEAEGANITELSPVIRTVAARLAAYRTRNPF
jgi:hypothetical protein